MSLQRTFRAYSSVISGMLAYKSCLFFAVVLWSVMPTKLLCAELLLTDEFLTAVEIEAPEQLKLIVSTRDKKSGQFIANVRIAVYDDISGELVGQEQTDQFGFATFMLPFTGSYRIETCNTNYLAATAFIKDCDSDGEPAIMCVEGFDFFVYDQAAEDLPAEHLLKTNLDLDPLKVGEIVDLNKIFYDYDKATLRPESRTELDELVSAMEQLPSLTIQLRSHTDSRGTDEYNQDLSQRRAQSVVDYLVANGIGEGRFSAIGFGESRLVNNCTDGVECTEAEHQNNRRTEFEIQSYEPTPCPDLLGMSANK